MRLKHDKKRGKFEFSFEDQEGKGKGRCPFLFYFGKPTKDRRSLKDRPLSLFCETPFENEKYEYNSIEEVIFNF